MSNRLSFSTNKAIIMACREGGTEGGGEGRRRGKGGNEEGRRGKLEEEGGSIFIPT